MTAALSDQDHLRQRVEDIQRLLEQAGFVDARGEAMTLVGLMMARLAQRSDDGSIDEMLEAAVKERKAYRSMARIVGFKNFGGLTLQLGDGVFEPCSTSERLIDHALASVSDRSAPLQVLDLGSGVGNLLLAALHELPEARGLGIDCNGAAVTLARINAAANDLEERCEFREGDAFEAIGMRFDMILGYLPWVPTAQLDSLKPEARLYDPIEALDGGRDGLQHYRRLVQSFDRMLAATGNGFFQVGYEHVVSLKDMFKRAGYGDTEVLRDGYGFPMGLKVGSKRQPP